MSRYLLLSIIDIKHIIYQLVCRSGKRTTDRAVTACLNRSEYLQLTSKNISRSNWNSHITV